MSDRSVPVWMVPYAIRRFDRCPVSGRDEGSPRSTHVGVADHGSSTPRQARPSPPTTVDLRRAVLFAALGASVLLASGPVPLTSRPRGA